VQRAGEATVLVIDPADTLRTAHIDCELESVQREGAREHIDALAQRYLGDRYQGPHQERLILRLRPTRISSLVAELALRSAHLERQPRIARPLGQRPVV
jgi:hypothetical protein